jgi:hypothetical protein
LQIPGNKLYGLHKVNINNQNKLFFKEMTFDTNQVNNLCEVELEPELELEKGLENSTVNGFFRIIEI